MSYQVVDDFEKAIAEYTGAPYVVTTNSCSSALTLALAFWRRYYPGQGVVAFPGRTYASAPMAAIHADYAVEFDNIAWEGEYRLEPVPVWDSARRFTSGMYRKSQFQCVSFQTSKILGLEQGGAILHDDPAADTWLRRARFDGRLNASEKLPRQIGFHAYLNPSTAALGLQHLSCLPKHNDDNGGSYLFDDLSQLDIWK